MVTLSLSQESQHVSWPISHKLCFSLMAGKHNVHHTQAALWKGILARISQGNSHIPRTHVRHDLFNLFQINVSSFFYKKKIKQKQNKLIVSVFRIETILFWKKWKQYWNNVILNKNYTWKKGFDRYFTASILVYFFCSSITILFEHRSFIIIKFTKE
jgi:hypothetical protein